MKSLLYYTNIGPYKNWKLSQFWGLNIVVSQNQKIKILNSDG